MSGNARQKRVTDHARGKHRANPIPADCWGCYGEQEPRPRDVSSMGMGPETSDHVHMSIDSPCPSWTKTPCPLLTVEPLCEGGHWPVSEYGPRCPSCEFEEATKVAPVDSWSVALTGLIRLWRADLAALELDPDEYGFEDFVETLTDSAVKAYEQWMVAASEERRQPDCDHAVNGPCPHYS